jgi:hypothetical protein
MSDDRPRAPTYGPPITIPSAYFLGLVATKPGAMPTGTIRLWTGRS